MNRSRAVQISRRLVEKLKGYYFLIIFVNKYKNKFYSKDEVPQKQFKIGKYYIFI